MAFAFSACGTVQNAPDTSTGALWTPAASADKIVVISDIHLGIDDKYSETIENRELLLDFLKKLENTTDVRELVINGDFLDEWYLPLTYARYDSSDKFYRQVVANNQNVIDALNSLMAKGSNWSTCRVITICC